jgi:hypothetical protein
VELWRGNCKKYNHLFAIYFQYVILVSKNDTSWKLLVKDMNIFEDEMNSEAEILKRFQELADSINKALKEKEKEKAKEEKGEVEAPEELF